MIIIIMIIIIIEDPKTITPVIIVIIVIVIIVIVTLQLEKFWWLFWWLRYSPNFDNSIRPLFNHYFLSYPYIGGIAARASDINTETAYALNLFNTKIPQPIEELLVLLPDAGVCLVDHQQVSQLNKSIDVRKSIRTCQCICAIIFNTSTYSSR